MPWLLFVLMAQRCNRFDARDWLRAIDGPILGQSSEARVVVLKQELAKAAGY